MGPNTWPAGAGTPESHLGPSAVLSGRSGVGFMSVIAFHDHIHRPLVFKVIYHFRKACVACVAYLRETVHTRRYIIGLQFQAIVSGGMAELDDVFCIDKYTGAVAGFPSSALPCVLSLHVSTIWRTRKRIVWWTTLQIGWMM